MKKDEIQGEINALKSLLADTDYNSGKLIEGLIVAMKDSTILNFVGNFISWLKSAVTDFGEIIKKRAAWRERINELEKMLEDAEVSE